MLDFFPVFASPFFKGRVEVRSQIDKGSTFTLFLPLDPESIEDAEKELLGWTQEALAQLVKL